MRPELDSAEFIVTALPALLRFGHVLTGSPQEAEDLVQEALAKSLRRWRRVSADDPVAYVRRVMVNTHVSRWRQWVPGSVPAMCRRPGETTPGWCAARNGTSCGGR
jgi:DNA-directed RNA polymerase specialized sigma24 family protein